MRTQIPKCALVVAVVSFMGCGVTFCCLLLLFLLRLRLLMLDSMFSLPKRNAFRPMP